MSDNTSKGFSLDPDAERTTGQAIGYWTGIGIVAIFLLYLFTGLLVRWALSGG